MLYKFKPVIVAGCCVFFSLWWLGVNNQPASEGDYTLEECAKDFSKIYLDLGAHAEKLGDLPGAITNYKRALEHKHDLLEAYDKLGICYEQQNDKHAALETYFKAMSINPNFIETRVCPGIIMKSITPERELFTDKKLWNGEPLTGKTLLVISEKGLGDTICFARFLPELTKLGARVLFKPQKPLLKLLEQAHLGIELIDHAEDLSTLNYDYYIPLLSLPYVLKISYDTMPGKTGYLKADDHKVKTFKETLFNTKKFKIGLVWQGDQNHLNDKNRSLALSRFYNLAKIPGVQCYSLQKGYGTQQLENLPKGVSVVNLDQHIKDFTDTAAIIKNLNLFITIDSAPVHLCGALDVPVWLLIPHTIDWRWLVLSEGDKTVWYDSVKKFRQPNPGNWEAVLTDVQNSLMQAIGEK